MSTATRSADFVAPHGPALLKCDGALELAAVRAPDAAAAVPAAAAASASRFDAGRSARPASAAERFSTGPCVDVAAASIGAAGAAGAVSIGWQLGYLQVQIWRACLQTQTAHLPVPANLMDRRHLATGIGILYSHLHGRITFTWHLIVAVAYDSIGMLSVKWTSALYQPSSLRDACTGACAIVVAPGGSPPPRPRTGPRRPAGAPRGVARVSAHCCLRGGVDSLRLWLTIDALLPAPQQAATGGIFRVTRARFIIS